MTAEEGDITMGGEQGLTSNLELTAAGLSDQGCGRAFNEDAFYVDVDRGLFLVADGIGGQNGGGVAAKAVVRCFPALLNRRLRESPGGPSKALRSACLDLNATIREMRQERTDLRRMGSTLACLLIRDGRAYIAHMGDSRVYRWGVGAKVRVHKVNDVSPKLEIPRFTRDDSMQGCHSERSEESHAATCTFRHSRTGGLTCLTQDHSLTALLVREGELSSRSAARHPGRGQLTRYVGMEQDIYPDVCSLRVRARDSFLLCTDGLWNVLPQRRIAGLLQEGAEPGSACAALIAAAKAAGSRDDITCIVVNYQAQASKSRIRPRMVYSHTEARP
jgi:protein phosphatase